LLLPRGIFSRDPVVNHDDGRFYPVFFITNGMKNWSITTDSKGTDTRLEDNVNENAIDRFTNEKIELNLCFNPRSIE
jgi:hypothetical protein